MKHQDLRIPTEKFDDLLADGFSFEEIGARLQWTRAQVRSRYMAICVVLGEKPDEN